MPFTFENTGDDILLVGNFEKLVSRLQLADRPTNAQIDPREEVFVRTGEGAGVVRSDGRGLSLEMQIFDTAGTPVGRKVAVGEVKAASAAELARAPFGISVDAAEPGSVEDVAPTTLLKARWEFNDGSSITAAGKGVSQLTPLKDGSALLADAASMAITEGSGQYSGARGIVSTIGTVFIPAGQDLPFGQPGAKVHQRTIETFKIVRGKDAQKVSSATFEARSPETRGEAASARSDPHEEVLLRYASGEGKVRRDGRGFNLEADLLRSDGSTDGNVIISWETHATEEQLTARRPSPRVKLDEKGPIAEVQTLTRVQAQWTFGDGSTLTGIGAGISSLSHLSEVALARDAAALEITSGTGQYAGARGLVTINGSVAAPEGAQIFGNPGAVATQNTVQTFRLVRGNNLKS